MNSTKKQCEKCIIRIIKYLPLVLFVLYVLYLLHLVLFSSYYGRGYFHRSINIIPLKTIRIYMGPNVSFKMRAVNIFGNIAAFVPMGLLLPLASKFAKSFLKSAFIVLASTFIIEIAQYIVGVGVFDIDDIILNFIGGTMGFSIYFTSIKIFKPKSNDIIKKENKYVQ